MNFIRAAVAIISAITWLSACGSTTTPSRNPRRQQEQPGLFDRMADQVTERQCNVGRFICPYGLGPAGEPCDCTDPSGVVIGGRTVK